MKRAACVLAFVFVPLMAIGCDSPEAPAPVAPVQPEPAPAPGVKNGPSQVPKKKKQPGLHSPGIPTSPKSNF